MSLSKQHHRHRSASDPFSDPSAFSYSPYGVPTLAKNSHHTHLPPSPPPKAPHKSSSRRPQTSPMAAQVVARDANDPLRDIVTVRHVDNPSSRVPMNRSQTLAPPSANVRAPAAPVRSASQDSAVVRGSNVAEKSKSSSRKPPTKKGSSHADVIDRMDFSGVGPMFHHDGPFDACAPSRNRHRSKAPMMAWTAANKEDKAALAQARDLPVSTRSPYPSTAIYAPYEPPKKKRDAIAEAWGIHEPEPFEDFSAGGGGVSARASGEYGNSATSSRNTTPRRSPKEGKDAREKYRDYLDDGQPQAPRRQPVRRATIPPPQPIFVPEVEAELAYPPSPTAEPASPGAPKRSRSIMHRIRKMRDAPNVPVVPESNGIQREDSPPSSSENAGGNAAYPQGYGPSSTRPTHKSQNSFLGRLGRGKEDRSPTSENSDAYAYQDGVAARKEKSLPTPPKDGAADNYFDATGNAYAGSPGGGGGLGRKTSLLKKMKTVVKGNNAR